MQLAKIAFSGLEKSGVLIEMPQSLLKKIIADDDADADGLLLSQAEMRSFFDPTIDKIIALVHEQLRSTAGIEVVFLVGGFSQSPYLTARIGTSLETNLVVCTVPRAAEAILYGAVLLGLTPATRHV